METIHLNFSFLNLFKINTALNTNKTTIINEGNGERVVIFKKNKIAQIHNQLENIINVGKCLYVL